MIVSNDIVPISINNFRVSIINGEKKWASVCLLPTETNGRYVGKFILHANMLPGNDTVRHITYDLSDTPKFSPIDFKGLVHGTFTWCSEVWDASSYVSCTYNATTAILKLSWVIPFCCTFPKPSPVFFDICID